MLGVAEQFTDEPEQRVDVVVGRGGVDVDLVAAMIETSSGERGASSSRETSRVRSPRFSAQPQSGQGSRTCTTPCEGAIHHRISSSRSRLRRNSARNPGWLVGRCRSPRCSPLDPFGSRGVDPRAQDVDRAQQRVGQHTVGEMSSAPAATPPASFVASRVVSWVVGVAVMVVAPGWAWQAQVGADEVQTPGSVVGADEHRFVAGVVVALHDQLVDPADLAVLGPDDVVGVLEGVQRVEHEDRVVTEQPRRLLQLRVGPRPKSGPSRSHQGCRGCRT